MGYITSDLSGEISAIVREYIRENYSKLNSKGLESSDVLNGGYTITENCCESNSKEIDSNVVLSADCAIIEFNRNNKRNYIGRVSNNILNYGTMTIGYALGKTINEIGVKPYKVVTDTGKCIETMIHRRSNEAYTKTVAVSKLIGIYKKRLTEGKYIFVSLLEDNTTLDIRLIENSDELYEKIKTVTTKG